MNRFFKKQVAGEVPTRDEITGTFKEFHNAYPDSTEKAFRDHWKTKEGKNSYEILCDVIKNPEGKKVLDLACGNGTLEKICLKKFPNLEKMVGVDVSDQSIAMARKNVSSHKIEFFCEDAHHLSLPGQSMDYVLCHLALFLMQPMENVIQEISRILKPGGFFAAVSRPINPKSGSLEIAFAKLFDKIVAEEFPNFSPTGLVDVRVDTLKGLENLFNEKTGFKNRIQVKDLALQCTETPEVLAGILTTGRYGFYCLSKAGQKRLLQEITRFFIGYQDKNGLVTFSITPGLILAQKK